MSKLKAIFSIVLIALILCMSGCFNPRDLDRHAYVLSIGLDKGENKKYYVSFLIQKDAVTESGSMEDAATVLAAEADSIYEAIESVQSINPQTLSFTRANTIDVSCEVAAEGLIDEFFRFEFDSIKLRDSVLLVIIDGNVNEFLEVVRKSSSISIAKLQIGVLELYKRTSTVAYANASLFHQHCVNGTGDQPLTFGYVNERILNELERQESQGQQEQQSGGMSDEAASALLDEQTKAESGGESGGNSQSRDKDDLDLLRGTKLMGSTPITMAGAALFDGMRLVGLLTPKQAQFLSLGRGEFGAGSLWLERDGNNSIELDIKRIKKHSVELTASDKPQINVTMELKINYEKAYTGLLSDDIRAEIEDEIEHELNAIFEFSRDLGSDAFCFGRYAVKQFATLEKWKAYDWKTRFRNATANFNVVLMVEG